MKKLITIIVVLFTLQSFSQTLPRQTSMDDQIIHYDGFIISYNNTHEQPNWVFYKMDSTDLVCETKIKRKNKFLEDYGILGHSAYKSDYKGSGYDRGHLKSSADESCDQEQNDETFFMSNMSPQDPSFNRGIWKKLESYVRRVTLESDSVYVYTGGVLTDGLKTIGVNEVSVPEFYYKIIYIFKDGKMEVLCFNLPNEKSNEALYTFRIELKALEKFVGINFPEKF